MMTRFREQEVRVRADRLGHLDLRSTLWWGVLSRGARYESLRYVLPCQVRERRWWCLELLVRAWCVKGESLNFSTGG